MITFGLNLNLLFRMYFLRYMMIAALAMGLSLPSVAEDSARRRHTKKSIQKSRKRKTRTKARTLRLRAIQAERQRLDSQRLLNGGTQPIRGSFQPASLEIEPTIYRFRRGDSTLSRSAIKALYYSHPSLTNQPFYRKQVDRKLKNSIEQSRFSHALQTVRRELWHSPMDIGLIKRACDLAHHEQHEHVELYLWQLVELFHTIEDTGTGLSQDSPLRVMSASDALLYETLWLDTPQSSIVRQTMSPTSLQDQLLMLEIETSSSQKLIRYYQILL